jgi:hypothetical protein
MLLNDKGWEKSGQMQERRSMLSKILHGALVQLVDHLRSMRSLDEVKCLGTSILMRFVEVRPLHAPDVTMIVTLVHTRYFDINKHKPTLCFSLVRDSVSGSWVALLIISNTPALSKGTGYTPSQSMTWRWNACFKSRLQKHNCLSIRATIKALTCHVVTLHGVLI